MDSIHDLNESDRKLLEDVLMKDIHELTDYDIQVLNARRSYLNYAQREAYKEILIDTGDMPDDAEQDGVKVQGKTEWNDPKKQKEQTTQTQQTQQLATPPADSANQQAANQQADPNGAQPAAPETPAQPNANPYDVNPDTLA